MNSLVPDHAPGPLPRLLPVLDLMDGHVVRGMGGRRDEYRPIRSQLVPSSNPLEVAQAIDETYGCKTFYVADLDAILHQRPQFPVWETLIGAGYELWVDRGLHTAQDALSALSTGIRGVIAGSETLADPKELHQLRQICPLDSLWFSLDLKAGRPLLSPTNHPWQYLTPLEIARQVVAAQIDGLIVLDLHDVGSQSGGSTSELVTTLRPQFPHLRLITGGGLRGPADRQQLGNLGVNDVLVASALHAGIRL